MKKRTPRILLVFAAFAVASLGSTVTAQQPGEAARIRAGYIANPVQLDMTGKNPALVGLGSYIVNAQGGCNDCHTAPPFAEGGDPFLGQPTQINTEGFLAGGTPFGPFISRNLTPNAAGRPAGLTLEEFLLVMNTGADLKNRAPHVPSAELDLLQVMPWVAYRQMTAKDKRAIYEYLRAIPCRGSAERCGN